MYKWFIVNNSTGALGTHESTNSPMVNQNGEQVFDSNLIPTGFSVVGPYDDKNNPMPSAYETYFSNPQAYLYQSKTFINNPNWSTIELTQAKTTQIALLEAGMMTTLNSGFTAKTLIGTATSAYTYPTNSSAQANFTGAITAFTANPNKTTVTVQTLDSGWVSHTKAEFFGIYTDGDDWKEAQYAQLNRLIAQVQDSATNTVSAVQAIVWQEATY